MSRILLCGSAPFSGSEVRTLSCLEFHDLVFVKEPAGAILALASSRFDLVIVDILLAGMDSLALIARLRDLALKIPIIGIIGAELPESMRPSLDFLNLAIEAGATCCLRRPLNPKQLLEAVNSNLGPSDDNQIVTLQPDLSAGIPVNRRVTIFDPADVSHEFREALAVLRRYVQEVEHESDCILYSPESVRDMVTCALKATERACRLADANRTEIDARETADVIALGNRAIDFYAATPCIQETASSDRNRLTPREREVLALVTDGVSNKVGGFRLSISVRTFEAHRANAMGKLGAKNAAELVRFGLERAR